MSRPTLFKCTNEACTLGSRVTPGLFSGGITAEQLHVITARPVEQIGKGEHGKGVCPNCGTAGVEYTAELELADRVKATKAAHARELAALKGEGG